VKRTKSIALLFVHMHKNVYTALYLSLLLPLRLSLSSPALKLGSPNRTSTWTCPRTRYEKELSLKTAKKRVHCDPPPGSLQQRKDGGWKEDVRGRARQKGGKEGKKT